MGLDMYLRAEQYVSGYDFRPEEETKRYHELVAQFEVGEYVNSETPSAQVSFTVAYWRKANAIHAWFVTNVQDGCDECQVSDVSREQLAELRNLCLGVLSSTKLVKGTVQNGAKVEMVAGEIVLDPILEEGQILASPKVAAEVLPTQGGFFFSGVDYDEGYYSDLESTVKQLDRALAMPESFSFEYHASW